MENHGVSLIKLVGILTCLRFLAVPPPRHSLGAMYTLDVALYVLAGVTEAKDTAIFAATPSSTSLLR